MTAWKKAINSGSWPLYFERDSINPTFGRFCIQPLQPDSVRKLTESLYRAMFDSLPGAAVVGFHLRLNRDLGADSTRTQTVLSQAQRWLRHLRITTAARFPLTAKATKTGPGIVTSSDLRFGMVAQIVGLSPVSIELLAGETLELEFLFNWGKGRTLPTQATNSELPRGWMPLDGSFSPVQRCDLSAKSIEVGPHRGMKQLIAEITTDGTLSPEDAIRRAGNHARLPPQPLAG